MTDSPRVNPEHVSNINFEQVEQLKSTEPQTSIAKLPTVETTKTQQAAKPETPKASVKEVALKVAGKGLMSFGIVAGAAIFPLSIGGGVVGALIGAGIGKRVGEGIKAFSGPTKSTGRDSPAMIGAQVGASIGSLLTFGFIRLGAHLLQEAKDLKTDRKLSSANAEKANQLEKDKDKLDTMQKELDYMHSEESMSEKAVADPHLRAEEAKVAVNTPNLRDAPDPDGVKYTLTQTRAVLSNRDSPDKIGIFEGSDIQKTPPKYRQFFETFNKEIEFQNSLSSDIEALETLETEIKANTNTMLKVIEELKRTHPQDSILLLERKLKTGEGDITEIVQSTIKEIENTKPKGEVILLLERLRKGETNITGNEAQIQSKSAELTGKLKELQTLSDHTDRAYIDAVNS